MPSARAMGAAFSMPWTAFVAVFLYYTALTLVTLGGGTLSVIFVAASYLVPVGVYLVILVNRAIGALTRMPVELWPTSNLILH